MKNEKKYYAYLVQCQDNSYYAGYTTDLSRRVQEHNQGIGAKYTFSRRPVVLVYYETFSSRREAMKREAFYKKLSHQQKKELVQSERRLHGG